MHQLTLFVDSRRETLPYARGSDTSQAAANSMIGISGAARWVVYDAIVSAGARGLTDHEIARQTGLCLDTARPRRVELRDRGHVTPSEERRLTPSGRSAVVWIATHIPYDEGG